MNPAQPMNPSGDLDFNFALAASRTAGAGTAPARRRAGDRIRLDHSGAGMATVEGTPTRGPIRGSGGRLERSEPTSVPAGNQRHILLHLVCLRHVSGYRSQLPYLWVRGVGPSPLPEPVRPPRGRSVARRMPSTSLGDS